MTSAPATVDRTTRTRVAVLAAATELLLERGVTGFTVEELVERTGIAKTTIYRHWPTRSDLLAATIDELGHEVSSPDTGTLRGDLLAFLLTGSRLLNEGAWPRHLRSLAGIVQAGTHDPAVVSAVDRTVSGMLDQVRAMLERGRGRGELRSDRDLDTVAGVLLGSIFFRTVFQDQDLSDDYIVEVVDTILDSLSEPPSRARRSRRA